MVNERKLSKAELSKREDIIMNMKDNKRDLVKKYGKEGMQKIQSAAGKRKSHAAIGAIKDKYEKG
jgi:hypothetical protein